MLTSGSHAWEKQELLQAEVLVVMPSSTKWSQASWWRRAMTWLARNGMNATTPPVWVPLMKGRAAGGGRRAAGGGPEYTRRCCEDPPRCCLPVP